MYVCRLSDRARAAAAPRRAQAHDEVLCGHQLRGRNRTKAGGTIINPRDKATVRSWRDHDMVVMAAAHVEAQRHRIAVERADMRRRLTLWRWRKSHEKATPRSSRSPRSPRSPRAARRNT